MCNNLITLKKYDAVVPCGKCPTCLARRASAWSFRLMQEEKRSVSSFFITLTYNNESVPINGRAWRSLRKSDLQKFFKRLRKVHEGNGCGNENRLRRSGEIRKRIKYFAVGEYGGRTFRPHYHVILFNVEKELMFSRTDLKMLEFSGYDGSQNVYCKQWSLNGKPLGTVTVGRVTGASVGYCLKYVMKEKKSRPPLHKNDLRMPEFAIMSKGIGLCYLTDNIKAWHRADLEGRCYVNIEGGKKATMARYLKDKLYTEEERKKIAEVGKMMVIKMSKLPSHRDWLNRRASLKAAYNRMLFNNLKNQKL